jgi:hypothetical protein
MINIPGVVLAIEPNNLCEVAENLSNQEKSASLWRLWRDQPLSSYRYFLSRSGR